MSTQDQRVVEEFSRQAAAMSEAAIFNDETILNRIRAHVERLEIVFPQLFAQVQGPHAVLEHTVTLSVIVDDFNVFRSRPRPSKAHAVLIVDPHAVSAGAVVH